MAGHVEFSSSLLWEGDRVTRAVGKGAQKGVNLALERLKALSVPLAPLDRGPLRASAQIRPATDSLAEGALIFDTPYAVIQHEDMSFQHDDGQAKYVEEPLTQNARQLHGIIAREVGIAILGS